MHTLARWRGPLPLTDVLYHCHEDGVGRHTERAPYLITFPGTPVSKGYRVDLATSPGKNHRRAADFLDLVRGREVVWVLADFRSWARRIASACEERSCRLLTISANRFPFAIHSW